MGPLQKYTKVYSPSKYHTHMGPLIYICIDGALANCSETSQNCWANRVTHIKGLRTTVQTEAHAFIWVGHRCIERAYIYVPENSRERLQCVCTVQVSYPCNPTETSCRP